MLKELKNNKNAICAKQTMPKPKTPQAGTSKNTSNKDDEANASELEDQENGIQDSPFRSSNINELRTPMQPLK